MQKEFCIVSKTESKKIHNMSVHFTFGKVMNRGNQLSHERVRLFYFDLVYNFHHVLNKLILIRKLND